MAGKPKKRAEEFKDLSTPDAIRIAAEKLCGELGVPHVKLRQIAKRVGVEPASVYNHYKGLNAVLAAVVKHSLIELIEIYRAAAEHEPRRAIRELCYSSTAFFAERIGITRLFIYDMADVDGSAAFNVNEELIEQLMTIEIGILKDFSSVDCNDEEYYEMVLARFGMVLTQVSSRWLYKQQLDDSERDKIAGTMEKFMMRYLA